MGCKARLTEADRNPDSTLHQKDLRDACAGLPKVSDGDGALLAVRKYERLIGQRNGGHVGKG